MKSRIPVVILLIVAAAISACSGVASAQEPNSPTITLPPGTAAHGNPIGGQVEFVDTVRAAGANVEPAGPITQPFFTPEGHILQVNGADVQVFEYENEEAMESEASQVAPDGGSTSTSMITWMDTPHFYKAGRIIVLYVGSDATILGLLEQVLGPQFAGR